MWPDDNDHVNNDDNVELNSSKILILKEIYTNTKYILIQKDLET